METEKRMMTDYHWYMCAYPSEQWPIETDDSTHFQKSPLMPGTGSEGLVAQTRARRSSGFKLPIKERLPQLALPTDLPLQILLVVLSESSRALMAFCAQGCMRPAFKNIPVSQATINSSVHSLKDLVTGERSRDGGTISALWLYGSMALSHAHKTAKWSLEIFRRFETGLAGSQ
ncbi:hypothetical protein PAAG_07304 [Paracoccidioides lutzii Pb01]|uniref:Uncharacterized protein n=1 Tax=Paracoccidioides lutzii (strain ATCC MYA-826 / Pb01) TaxID=502779 RepID=C1H963_PARBA|nr:hypothetical protein PAAG_07304 [Paracoccidioides lutzii Pb01]EEH36886.2 hypothetical protein PAAG_07304 [Paracoccidioides lutzii Pb01]